MIIDFKYPFLQTKGSIYEISKNITNPSTYQYSAAYKKSITFELNHQIQMREVRVLDLTIDVLLSQSSTVGGDYVISFLYSDGTIKSRSAISVEEISSDDGIYKNRVRFLWASNNTYHDSYNLNGFNFSVKNAITDITIDGEDYFTPALVVNDCVLAKDINEENIDSSKFTTGVYTDLKIGCRPNSLLPANILVNMGGSPVNATEMHATMGQPSNITDSAIIQNVLSSDSEAFKLYKFTAFNENITIDYPVPYQYDNKPVMKIFSIDSVGTTTDFDNTSKNYAKRFVSASERFDGKSVKMDCILTQNKEYYIFIATGPKQYFGGISKEYPGSLYIYHDENATYDTKIFNVYDDTYTGGTNHPDQWVSIKENVKYSLLDYRSAFYKKSGSGYSIFYKFIPAVDGIYNIYLTNNYTKAGYQVKQFAIRTWYYSNNNSPINGLTNYMTGDITKTIGNIELIAGQVYFISIVLLDFSYITANVDLEIRLQDRGTSENKPLLVPATSLDSIQVIDLNDDKYSDVFYTSDRDVYIKFWQEKDIDYRIIVDSGNSENIMKGIYWYNIEGSVNLGPSNYIDYTQWIPSNYSEGYRILQIGTSTAEVANGKCRILINPVKHSDAELYENGIGRSLEKAIYIDLPNTSNKFNTVELSKKFYGLRSDPNRKLWFSIPCISGYKYTIESIFSNKDNYIYLYNQNGEYINEDDDHDDMSWHQEYITDYNLNFGIIYTATYTGRLYFAICLHLMGINIESDGYCDFTITKEAQ